MLCGTSGCVGLLSIRRHHKAFTYAVIIEVMAPAYNFMELTSCTMSPEMDSPFSTQLSCTAGGEVLLGRHASGLITQE
jgi:hypothetical protein